MKQVPESEFKPFEVADDRGEKHQVLSVLGSGGQGTVYLTAKPRVLVKLVRLSNQQSALRKAWRAHVGSVAQLGLPDRLPIAAPEAFVETVESIGYTMRFLEEMEPLAVLCRPPATDVAGWYLQTGGLRRRLAVLAQAADVLAALHGEGIVYGDVSPFNIFVSSATGETSAWLIDTDNLRWTTTSTQPTILTPKFGAPEIVRAESGNTSTADEWSFAVVAHQVLTLNHPFTAGQMVEDGDLDEMEALAAKGELPWIHDAADDRNSCALGIPAACVLAKGLTAHFQATFGPGRLDPVKRKTIAEWAEVLNRSALALVRCLHCSHDYYGHLPQCPWCAQATGQYVRVLARVMPAPDSEIPELLGAAMRSPKLWWWLVLQEGRDAVVSRRMCTGELGEQGRQTVLTLKRHPKGVLVCPGADAEIYQSTKGTEHKPSADRQLRLDTPVGLGYRLRVGSPSQTHLMLSFEVQ